MAPGISIRPYKIEVPQADLDDLRERLSRTRWPDELPGVGWDYGVPLSYVKELVAYWQNDYDWRKHEARLNEFPGFMTTIDGADIHFLHIPSAERNALPLVLTHGWPGSIIEFAEMIGPLTDPLAHGGDAADAFHVVIPSMPGYGFSGPTRDTGWTPRRIAGAFAVLMQALGYERYGAQGGDWGSRVSRDLAHVAPENVAGVHLNMLTPFIRQGDPLPANLTPDETRRIQAAMYFRREGAGYFTQQSTRPQTLAYGLTDSPVGQLAWIVEKFREWTDNTGSPEDAVDRETLLTNVMFYWLTGTAGSSARLYYETMHGGQEWGQEEPPSEVPTGVAVFPREIAPSIRSLTSPSYNIVHWSEFDRGGHFAALEEPDLLVDDIRAFFRPLRS